ncbi:peptidase dimerization domain-containing protein [Nocardia yamanashiensis]|uniref:peptidase dimerization domain-containing protein n=1 Tax=Nocardia yamanashiensis TaxID=209247 RepID=UPI001E55A422|nr:peptidase dimerization domain-containing protein [Nocardia yamanashiensis]UGT40855.1 peptidase dimerization domain-containing protein [Nocardia yamanashiensis]
MPSILEDARAIQDDLFALRRSLHREPEIGSNLPLTQAKVLAALDGPPLEITRGGHGAFPHTALDPAPALCETVLAIQNFVTLRFDAFDPVVITVGHLSAATVPNVIPANARFDATVRCFSEPNQTRLQSDLPNLAHGIAFAHGLHAHGEYTLGHPVLINAPAQTTSALTLARTLFGPDLSTEHPTPGASEDFAYILQRVPGTILTLGATPPHLDPTTAPDNHSPEAVFDDSVLWRQAALLTELALLPGATRPTR